MAYYWWSEDVPELAAVPRTDRKLWWCIARNESRSGLPGSLIGWLDAVPWFGVFLAFSHADPGRQHGPFFAVACIALALAVDLALDAGVDQPLGRHWLREHMHEYRQSRPWLHPSAIAAAEDNGREADSRSWRLQDIPELCDVPVPRRRALWREAISRSTTPQTMLRMMLIVFMVAMVAGSACRMLFPAILPLWAELLAAACASFVTDRWFRWPAARRWLREHAHELDRYVPA